MYDYEGRVSALMQVYSDTSRAAKMCAAATLTCRASRFVSSSAESFVASTEFTLTCTLVHFPSAMCVLQAAVLSPARHAGHAEVATPVPWGTACLAVLVQRSSDQAPSVRSRALSQLAGLLGKAQDLQAFCKVC